ncbi:alpha/beta hydrolase [Streptoalloteichus hindustanus]|uniref:Pimeloyl-ACP methyl ester carboxylesterase n=1 Tax=Streptoalloteichus hindustanus TaxID=2017 RepID=A0A1M5IBP6_STRHI|nr:alpha/beta hydrolase [Streptoalloteichus hindustanus]SHG25726.1 Pimeloyl-ACP methyl ester carboxylesterase [Streptoalloteichus hindustanus]
MGLGVSRFWWPPGLIAELVGRGFQVVAYDQRDAGQSTRFAGTEKVHPVVALFRPRPPAYSAEDMTDDAAAVLDALGWESAHLLGHSTGGLLVQRTALRHPGRVRAITISGAVPSDAGPLRLLRYVNPGTVARFSRLRFPEDREGDVALGLALSRALAAPGHPWDEAAARAVIGRDVVSGVRDNRAQSRQIGAKWHGARLAEIRVPTVVPHGEQAPLIRPSAALHTASAIPGARLVLPARRRARPSQLMWSRVADEVRGVADRARSAPRS